MAMNTNDFLSSFDEDAVVRAIRDAESLTSGQIVVYVSRRSPADPVARATRRFRKLGLERTRQRNAVMLYFAPRVRKFAVIGDTGIHAVCGQAFWDDLAQTMSSALREHPIQEAVILAVRRVGELLARHFPAEEQARNELPDGLIRD